MTSFYDEFPVTTIYYNNIYLFNLNKSRSLYKFIATCSFDGSFHFYFPALCDYSSSNKWLFEHIFMQNPLSYKWIFLSIIYAVSLFDYKRLPIALLILLGYTAFVLLLVHATVTMPATPWSVRVSEWLIYCSEYMFVMWQVEWKFWSAILVLNKLLCCF